MQDGFRSAFYLVLRHLEGKPKVNKLSHPNRMLVWINQLLYFSLMLNAKGGRYNSIFGGWVMAVPLLQSTFSYIRSKTMPNLKMKYISH